MEDRRKALENGMVLTILIGEHAAARDEKSFVAMLNCLSDNPPVWVPANATVSDEDVENILRAGVGGEVTTKHQIRMKPDILVNGEGKKFFPVFSRKEEAPEAYRNQFSWMQMSFEQAAAMTMQKEDLEGLVLNGFSDAVVMVRELAEIMYGIIQSKKEQ